MIIFQAWFNGVLPSHLSQSIPISVKTRFMKLE